MDRYIAITPARDEERFLPGLIESMAGQVRRPQRWIVIDDGSADATARILDEAARRHDWIEPVHLARNRPREAGGESVIMQFLPRAAWQDVDFIFRLDADLSFAPDFVQLMLNEFAANPRLGIAGATLYERFNDRWHEARGIHSFHTRGATKMYSARCFSVIQPLESCAGWDTIDEMRALMNGFKTQSFRHIRAYHHRPQGAAAGAWRGHFGKGQTAYYVGYSPFFLVARAARMAVTRPVSAICMAAGYFDSRLRGRPNVNDAKLINFIRRQQVRRLLMLDSVWR
ncbi:MAG: glycosyltransferase family A protein [Candidatus Binatus sp.]|uniref:glycosyltransferase family 2 protein n=1 Tax=Candidatus Binatus sp. TaxID=2811406 RepID=UPI002719C4A2|nr:glycosyltransferase family A protein [Candidatus Binatus sp.]MDO8432676.1 glycosyltransferase family A protein [Candidatus Binatus sp.]